MSETNHIQNNPSLFETLFKWIGISFISIVLATIVLISILAWKFSPLIKIDDNGVEILGGTITINNTKGDRNFSIKKEGKINENKSSGLENFI